MEVKPTSTAAFKRSLDAMAMRYDPRIFAAYENRVDEVRGTGQVPEDAIRREMARQIADYMAAKPGLINMRKTGPYDSMYEFDRRYRYNTELVVFNPDDFEKFLEAYKANVLQEFVEQLGELHRSSWYGYKSAEPEGLAGIPAPKKSEARHGSDPATGDSW